MKRDLTKWLRRPFFGVFLLSLMLALAVSCDENNGSSATGEYIPEAPDYTDDTMWFTQENDATGQGADVFYLVSTWEVDWETADGRVCHYADVHNPEHRADMDKEISRIAGYMGVGNNFYSPYYRQITLDSWESEETAESRFPYAMEDVFRAFEYYMEHWNGGRPFFIAGFSQGAKCTLELLKSLDAEERELLIAAYVVGYKVTEDDLRNVNVRPAEGPADCGVTVCYNSVESPECASPGIAASEICINPLNWSCGPEPAVVRDTVEISVDTAANVLVVKGLDSDRYYHPSLAELFVKGNYHLLELELYADALRENVRVRAESFFAGKR